MCQPEPVSGILCSEGKGMNRSQSMRWRLALLPEALPSGQAWSKTMAMRPRLMWPPRHRQAAKKFRRCSCSVPRRDAERGNLVDGPDCLVFEVFRVATRQTPGPCHDQVLSLAPPNHTAHLFISLIQRRQRGTEAGLLAIVDSRPNIVPG